jgi:hypothetical protein
MNLYLTGVPERTTATHKIQGIKLLREHLGLTLVSAKQAYDAVEAGKAALLMSGVAPPMEEEASALTELRDYGFTLEFADSAPELPEPPGAQPVSLEAQRTLSILLNATEGSVVKVAMLIKLLGKTHDEEFWDEVFRALTESFNVMVEQ